MKYQNSRPPLDERDKLRKFRELDDAFAEALRELDQPDGHQDIPTGPPVRTLDELDEQEAQQQRETQFLQRLETLMQEYALPAENVCELLSTLRSLGKMA